MMDSGFNTNEPITSAKDYKTRRQLLRAGVIGATALATGVAYRKLNGGGHRPAAELAELPTAATLPTTQAVAAAFKVNEPPTPLSSILNYNNFYEFSTDKDGVAEAAAGFDTHDWKIEVDGLCSKPTTFNLDDLRRIAPLEERIYRMRCVEAWSMVIPWNGYSLSALLDRVQPQSGAKYVAFTTLFDKQRMPGQRSQILDWPYVEGLRMDEAMHPLTLLASGLYGKALPPQDGAPIRLVVPWKYGFKGIKSIVKISLVADMPPTSWNRYATNEYGFYANVNPNVDHPRWSQATEQRIGGQRIPTLMFNGYADQVGMLYSGMDLSRYF